MADIFHQFPIKAPKRRVFEMVSTPEGLDRWWTESSAGRPSEGEEYSLGFGPGYDWRAVVSVCRHDREFELTMTESLDDWRGSRIGFSMEEDEGTTTVRFHHAGWREDSEHYRISMYCWAMYLRVMKRYLEFGETVPYKDRLDV